GVVGGVGERVGAGLERLEVGGREAGRRLAVRDERARARGVLAEEVEAWIGERAGRGLPLPSAEGERGLVEAVWAALFGLGALQPLLEREDVENIHIHGHDRLALGLAVRPIDRC